MSLQCCPIIVQRVPVPHDGPPMQRFSTRVPQAMRANSSTGGQCGMHTQVRVVASQLKPGSQPPRLQVPPQPSGAPQAVSAVHRGVQLQVAVSASQTEKGLEHAPTQRPPQPSSAPHAPPATQFRAHWHWPTTQRSREERLQGGLQAQVSTQRPATQSDPGEQLTPAQGLRTQRPSAQTSVDSQLTPSQLERGRHCTWQAKSGWQAPVHGTMGAQPPVVSSQNWPAGQEMPEQGAGKQPGVHRPRKQVSWLPQGTPAQRSRVGTQRMSQRESGPQGLSVVRQLSSAQRPWRQRAPKAQASSELQFIPTAMGTSAGGMSRAGTSIGTMSKACLARSSAASRGT
nr:hypothetical protein [Deltaproteobacteria bacterium]